MAITWCELDEGFRNASCHGGAYTIPALLAEAEAQGRTVEEVLRALAVAYEVTTRFALAFPFPVFNVHPHAAFAPIGAAVATSLVRRHDAKTMLDAVTGGGEHVVRRPVRYGSRRSIGAECLDLGRGMARPPGGRLGRGRDRRRRGHAVRRLRRIFQHPRRSGGPGRRPRHDVVGRERLPQDLRLLRLLAFRRGGDAGAARPPARAQGRRHRRDPGRDRAGRPGADHRGAGDGARLEVLHSARDRRDRAPRHGRRAGLHVRQAR